MVRQHGGAVVDFSGDGLMAVFGGLRPLEEKEAAAVRAGRAIVDAVRDVPVAPGARGAAAPPLEVGVGIATGEAFVGTIRSVERDIWSVLGNTTNLAARLESLTRDFDAAIVIDEVTADRVRDHLEDFQALGPHPIRGRSRAVELYALPRRAAAPPGGMQR